MPNLAMLLKHPRLCNLPKKLRLPIPFLPRLMKKWKSSEKQKSRVLWDCWNCSAFQNCRKCWDCRYCRDCQKNLRDKSADRCETTELVEFRRLALMTGLTKKPKISDSELAKFFKIVENDNLTKMLKKNRDWLNCQDCRYYRRDQGCQQCRGSWDCRSCQNCRESQLWRKCGDC